MCGSSFLFVVEDALLEHNNIASCVKHCLAALVGFFGCFLVVQVMAGRSATLNSYITI